MMQNKVTRLQRADGDVRYRQRLLIAEIERMRIGCCSNQCLQLCVGNTGPEIENDRSTLSPSTWLKSVTVTWLPVNTNVSAPPFPVRISLPLSRVPHPLSTLLLS